MDSTEILIRDRDGELHHIDGVVFAEELAKRDPKIKEQIKAADYDPNISLVVNDL